MVIDRLVEGTRRYIGVVTRADFNGLLRPLADEETPVPLEDVEGCLPVNVCMWGGLASGRTDPMAMCIPSAPTRLCEMPATRMSRARRDFNFTLVCPDDLELCHDQSIFRIYGANLPVRCNISCTAVRCS